MTGFKYNYKLVIAYDGTQYSGWQIQPNATSIQAIVQETIKIIIRQEVVVVGSGRTDAGVHALGQVAHFKCDIDIDPHRFFASINGLLPFDIRVLHIERTSLNFHAQHNAISKTYHYHLCLERVQSPFRRLYSLHAHYALNIPLLKQAAALFIGTHDFTSFTNEAHKGCAAQDPVRTLQRLDVVPEEGGVRLEFQANGFLYKMVRTIVGTLLDVSCGKRQIDEISKIFKATDRRCAGQAAPAHGLFLMEVNYAGMSDKEG